MLMRLISRTGQISQTNGVRMQMYFVERCPFWAAPVLG